MFAHWPEAWFSKTAVSRLRHGFFNEESICCDCSHGKGQGFRHTTSTHSALVSYSIVYTRGIWDMAALKEYLAFHSAFLHWSRTYDQAVSPGSPLKEVLRQLWGASSLQSDGRSIPLWRWRGLGIWTIGRLSFPQIISIGSNLCALPHFTTTTHSWPNLPQKHIV